MQLVTGATGPTLGLYYASGYDRTLYPPGSCTFPAGTCTNTPGTSVAGSCVNGVLNPGATPGTQTSLSENLDADLTLINGGGQLNVSSLPLDKNCNPVYPWNFPRVNNIYDVLTAYGLESAWSDKEFGEPNEISSPY